MFVLFCIVYIAMVFTFGYAWHLSTTEVTEDSDE